MANLAPLLLILAGNNDMHKSLDKFKFRPDPTIYCGFAAIEHLKKV